MKIIAVTTNFGFGPSSKLYSIVKELLDQGYNEITFCGNGESLNFFKNNFENSLNYIECDTDRINAEDFLKIINIETFDILVNVMNVNIPKIQSNKELKIKSVFVDSLSWMWDKPIAGVDKYNLYFVQDTFMDAHKISDFNNVQLISPIVNTEGFVKEEKKNKILLNFAGIMTPYENDIFYQKYIFFYLTLFSKIPEIDQYEVVCACNKMQKQWLERNTYFNCNFSFRVMNHAEFLQEACESSKVFSTPGLTFYLESQSLNLNVFYLLPSNYSQALLLEKYSNNNVECNTLSKYGYKYSTNELLEEEEGVNSVRTAFFEIVENYSEELLNDLTKNIDKSFNSFLKVGSDFKKENGVQTIVRIMREKGVLKS